MGSGELTPTMVPVHRELLARFDEPRAVFLDTPAGFQLNVDQISQRAREYFESRLQTRLQIASFKSADRATALETEEALLRLRQADYVLVGPGSPSYAVKQWTRTRIPDVLREIVERGSVLVAASAASLTVGRLTLPVYEIYKVGESPYWLEGLNLLSRFDLPLVVVPHWNNAEGGTHDTRFCYMGRPRFEELERLIPGDHGLVGLDEHTACILDLESGEARVEGLGTVTVRWGGSESVHASGSRFPFSVLRGQTPAASANATAAPVDRPAPSPESKPSFWATVHDLRTGFEAALETHQGHRAIGAILELDRAIWKAHESSEDSELISQAREVEAELLVLLGTHVESLPASREECLQPLVDGLLELRSQLRREGRWADADAVRQALARAGVVVQDTPDGPTWQLRR
jgi:peptidase E